MSDDLLKAFGQDYRAAEVTPGGETILIQYAGGESVRVAMKRVESIRYFEPAKVSGLCDFQICTVGQSFAGSAPPDQIDLLLKVWERRLTPIYGVETR